jgi:antirestriction protein ArdC
MSYTNGPDIYERVTAGIISALEAGVQAGDYSCPWNRVKASVGGTSALPVNLASHRVYRGVNVPILWCAAQAAGYDTQVWGTFKQWQDVGAVVRKGEKATHIVFWKPIEVSKGADAGADSEEGAGTKTVMLARGYCVFNVSQVDGYAPKASAVASTSEAERIDDAETFFRNTGAVIRHGQAGAWYVPSQDYVGMPDFDTFKSPTHYYHTLAHELVHWTGHKDRLARDFSGRFGDSAYAAEELVADIGAAMVTAGLGLSNPDEPRRDRAGYVKGWLDILRGDKRAIFTAAAQSQRAADYLAGLQAQTVAIAA